MPPAGRPDLVRDGTALVMAGGSLTGLAWGRRARRGGLRLGAVPAALEQWSDLLRMLAAGGADVIPLHEKKVAVTAA